MRQSWVYYKCTKKAVGALSLKMRVIPAIRPSLRCDRRMNKVNAPKSSGLVLGNIEPVGIVSSWWYRTLSDPYGPILRYPSCKRIIGKVMHKNYCNTPSVCLIPCQCKAVPWSNPLNTLTTSASPARTSMVGPGKRPSRKGRKGSSSFLR